MPVERFFSRSPLISDASFYLKDKEFHHFAHVIRGTEGDIIELIDGKGGLAKAKVASIKKNQAILHIDELNFSTAPHFKIILAQAIPRLPRLDFILEKGTELGVTEFWLFPGERSERVVLSDHQKERMETITISAIKQCGRLYLPKLVFAPKLKDWPQPQLSSFYGDVSAEAPLLYDHLQGQKLKNGIIFFIGPESGFSDGEISKLHSMNSKGVKLNDFILRTDTAALCALSLISHFAVKNDHSIQDRS